VLKTNVGEKEPEKSVSGKKKAKKRTQFINIGEKYVFAIM
jgi:hypothetical protein